MEPIQTALPSLRASISIAFFSFACIFLLFSVVLKFLKSNPWCTCDVCRAYVSSSWAAEFDNLIDWYAHLLRQSPTGTIRIHVLRNIVTANPDNVEYMLKTRFDNFPKGKPFSAILGDFLGRGIFNVDGESWMFQRKMACLELSNNSVRSYSSSVVRMEVRDRLLPLLGAAANSAVVIDLQDVFRKFAFDNIFRISFGLDPASLELSLPASEFAEAFDQASMLSARRAAATFSATWKLKRLLNWGSEKELRDAIGKVDALADGVIRRRRKLGFVDNHDLLSRFMGSVNDEKYLRDIVISFMLAGRDTVASGLTSFFMLLSKNPRARDCIREEIERVMDGDANDVATYDQLRDMHYVHAALYECMRLYPPVQFDSKFCLDDDVLPDGTYVGQGTRVTYHPYAMGRMEKLWGDDCEEFRPERWLSDGVFAPANPFKYPVFQAGLRVCLGKEMAVMEMKTVIVSVVRGFDVDVVDGSRPLKFAPGLTATIRGGLPARVRRRRSM